MRWPAAITTLRSDIAKELGIDRPRYRLDAGLQPRRRTSAAHRRLPDLLRAHHGCAPPDVSWSWTENWPYEPEVGNTPTTNTFVWTWASFCFTFLAFGLVLFIYEFWLNHPDDAPMDPVLARFRPLTESQRKVGKYFLVVAAVLLLQIAAGTIMAHAYYDRRSFYGIALHEILPFNFLRDVHIQTPIVWIGVSWIGAGLFLAPGDRRRPGGARPGIARRPAVLGDAAHRRRRADRQLARHHGLHRHRLVLVRQPGTVLHPARAVLADRLLRRPARLERTGVPRAVADRRDAVAGDAAVLDGAHPAGNLIWAATINIAVLYVFGMIPLTGIEKSFTITDFWRWWVVHLWVEQSFEFFAASMSAYLLMAVGLVSRKLAERAVYFELILIFLGGVLGTGHHLYWAGGPSMWVPMGSMFSFIEVLPLVLLIIEAIGQYRLIRAHQAFNYWLAYTYIIGAAFWNFVGAGVFGGGTLNAPLINYYEHGTFLTLNHAHTALFGAFGLLAIGLVYFCLRYAGGRAGAVRRAARVVGVLAVQCRAGAVDSAELLPDRLAAARRRVRARTRLCSQREFYNTTLFWQWMRLPGDVVFAVAALLMAWDFP